MLIIPPLDLMSEKIFIGVAWPYANGSLHLGHIAGCYLPADIFARYNRLIGNDVLMVSGSDEHGTPITITAEKENVTPQDIVDKYNKEHTENMKNLGISFDLFTRTTTKNHEEVVKDVFLSLYNKKFIYKKTIDSYYCKDCERYLPDRYIEGECPHCKCIDARGDQCDNCGKLIDSGELKKVRCKLCGGTPVLQKTNHLFFSLSKFEDKLIKWIEEKKHWKANVKKFTHNWLIGGLIDRAVTRDLSWGIPVPIKDFEDKRIYVWFDAVIGYLAASKQWANIKGDPNKWQDWWKSKDAKHYYFLAKDNIPFHSIIWPSILMGYDEDLNLPHDIPANEYLCLSGEQFSKSRCVAVWVPDILEEFDTDAIRYYLSINMPENKDSNWIWADFVAKNNDELVGAYGNFVHRVITFTSKNYGEIPKRGMLNDLDNEVLRKIEETGKEVGNFISNCNFKKGLRAVMDLAKFGNFYFDQNQPWAIVKEQRERCATVLNICLKIVQALAVFSKPYMPFSSNKIWNMIGFKDSIKSWESVKLDLNEGFSLDKPKPLFKKLELDCIVKDSDPFSKLDLRVAKIEKVSDHPDADKLYVLDLDVGPLGKRTIVAGMKPYYSKVEMLNKSIIIVTNLKPAKIRGVKSSGMLLAAEDENGNCSLLNPKDANPGCEIYIEGIAREPSKVLEFEDFLKVKMEIDEKQRAIYNGKTLKSKFNLVVTDKKIKKGTKVR